MKNRKWISLAVSALLSVTALPTMAFAEEAATETVKEATAKTAKELTEMRWRIRFFMHRSMWRSKRAILRKKEST